MGDSLTFGQLNGSAIHLCVDMQRLFSPEGPWPTPWMERVLPAVMRIAENHPRQTIFTRFRPPWSAEAATGQWQNLYRKWPQVTQRDCDPALFDLMEPLPRLTPPATVFDKNTYSAFADGLLRAMLERVKTDTLVISGSETDVCVVATVMQAVDLGYRVIVASDAICSSSDEGHDRLLAHFRERLGQQVETANSEEILAAWSGRSRVASVNPRLSFLGQSSTANKTRSVKSRASLSKRRAIVQSGRQSIQRTDS